LVVRLFYPRFAVLFYYRWLPVVVLVQFSLGVEYQRKLRVTAKLFLNFAK
jgi:hypothetical protein